VANLLAVWRVHGLDEILRRVWAAGVVLAGVSAGSICWFEAVLPTLSARNCRPLPTVWDSCLCQRRALRRRGPPTPLGSQVRCGRHAGYTHCTDDGVGMLYRGTNFVEAVSEQAGKAAYIVSRDGDSVVEERLETRLLGQ